MNLFRSKIKLNFIRLSLIIKYKTFYLFRNIYENYCLNSKKILMK